MNTLECKQENQTMEEEKLILAAKGWIKKGYLLYLYYSCSTHMYECKPVDPKFYSKNELENFRNKLAANCKLYDNIEEMLLARGELNSNFCVVI